MPAWDAKKTYAAILLTSLLVALAGLAANGLMYRSGPVPAGTGVAPQTTHAEVPGILPLLAGANIADGRVAFAGACGSCHTFTAGAGTLVGPDLYGVVGAPVAGIAGYPYSEALRKLGGRWSYERLNRWLLDPQAVAPGTLMSYPGMPSLHDRADVIAFLRTLAPKPVPLPTPAEIAAAAAARPPHQQPRTDTPP